MADKFKNDTDSHIKQNVDSDGIVIPPEPTLEGLFNKRNLHTATSNHPKTSTGSFQFFRWLLETERPQHKKELRRRINKLKKEENVWVWPFAVAFLNDCFTFLQMEIEDQRYIVAAREDNVSWRGDDIDFFRTVYDNTMIWRGLPDKKKHQRKEKVKDEIRQRSE